jgi:hypothetical protein
MLSNAAIREKALGLARAQLGLQVKDVVVADDADSEGRKSLRVTVLIKSGWSATPPGDKLVDITTRLNSFLSGNDDQRFAYTHYMTPREFTASDAGRKPISKPRRAAG